MAIPECYWTVHPQKKNTSYGREVDRKRAKSETSREIYFVDIMIH